MIEVNRYKTGGENLPKEFNGFKIAHLSDFHNRRKNDEIIERLKEEGPNIIAITGDFIDSRKTNTQISLDFAKKLVSIATCYYVMGNHESRLTEIYPEFEKSLIEIGVTVLRNQVATIEKNGEAIQLIGIDDPRLSYKKDNIKRARMVIKEHLSKIKCEGYKILMCHRPEAFLEYVDAQIDLALTGHAHGGQIILPLIGGIIAPNQGLFPKYYKGMYSRDKTSMIVNRGLGNSLFPFRFNNRPEIIVIELEV